MGIRVSRDVLFKSKRALKNHRKRSRISYKCSSLAEKVTDCYEDVDGIGELSGISNDDTIVHSESDVSQLNDDGNVDSIMETIPDLEDIIIASKVSTVPDADVFIAEQEDQDSIEAPGLRQIVKFAIPAIGVWLCSPLLSLIDTSTVGLLSGTAQQAALNPAVAVTDYGALLVAFMYTATTNLVAGARESEKKVEGKPKTSRTLVSALQLSGYVGMTLGVIMSAFAPVLLKGIIGNDSIDPEVFSAALRYVRIRALGMPAAVVIGSAQSACLGMQDIKSPMYVLLAAAVVNFIGDMIFVPNANAWIGGAAGAAWATVFSQYAALGMFLKWLRSKPKTKPNTVNLTNAILELTGDSDDGKSRRMQFKQAIRKLTGQAEKTNSSRPAVVSPPNDSKKTEEYFSTRGFLEGKIRKRALLRFPPIKEAKEFWPYVLPVTTTSIGRVSAYVAMSHVVSSSLGTLSMAANQVILSVFYCLCPIADSLNLTAQSFIPGIHQRERDSIRAEALKKVTRNFFKAGIAFGGFCVGIVSLIPFFSHNFTSDPLVLAKVHSVVPLLAGIFSIHGLICAGEGLLLGQKDLGFLGKSYASFFFGVPYFMLRLKRVALGGVKAVGLGSLWEVFFCYQLVRLSLWGLRLHRLNKKAFKEAAHATVS
jgi:Na+-driven multidrug efflux pump